MPVIVFFVVLALVLAATVLGLYLGRILPKHHLSEDSRTVIRAFMDLNALLATVVLGLLIFSAKTSFDTKDTEWRHASANIIMLDRLLVDYGPETRDIRARLRQAVTRKLAQIEQADPPAGELIVRVDDMQKEISALVPTDDAQRWLKSKALDVGNEIARARWFLIDEIDVEMPLPFLVITVFWIALIFFSYGLISPINATVLTVVVLCAISLAAAIYLILEMDRSVGGLISISTEPLRQSLIELER